jgi:magnesium chelatase subunit I
MSYDSSNKIPDLLPSDLENNSQPQVKSLRELINLVTGRDSSETTTYGGDSGLAEILPFPFLGLVGQYEMKLALILAIINPGIGGVLLIGPRGTGKTTAVRSLLDLLPYVTRSACFYGCLPEDIESGGIDAVCPDCAKKYGEGIPLTHTEKASLVELPLNSRLEDVVGGIDERAAIHDRMRLKRGILARADQNILYVDEANLLADEIVDAILDAASQGSYTVRRGPISATYRSNLTLIGSMNPEEGNLRPQMMDRFGMRIIVRGLEKPQERLLAYQRVREYRHNQRRFLSSYKFDTDLVGKEIQEVRKLLPEVILPKEVAFTGIELIKKLKIDSLRAEITLFEAARSYVVADGRTTVTINDLRVVAPMALRLRRSQFMNQYLEDRHHEDEELQDTLEKVVPGRSSEHLSS